jgi:hypothetical protein
VLTAAGFSHLVQKVILLYKLYVVVNRDEVPLPTSINWRKVACWAVGIGLVGLVLFGIMYGVFWHLTLEHCAGYTRAAPNQTSYPLYCTDPPHTARQARYVASTIIVWACTTLLAAHAYGRWRVTRSHHDMAALIFLLVLIAAMTLLFPQELWIIFTAHRPY